MESSSNPKYLLEIEIKALPPSPNSYGSAGARQVVARHRKEWRQRVALIVGFRRPPHPLTKAIVICTRYSTRAMDYDNRAMSFKPVVDGLVDARVLVDDSDEIVVYRDYPMKKCKAGGEKITIRVEEVTLADLAHCLLCKK